MLTEHSIRCVMTSSQDAKIVETWVEKYPNPHTQYCYRFDSERLLNCVKSCFSA